MEKTITLGKVSVSPKGVYSSTTSYTFLDVVSNAGGAFLCLQNSTGVEPGVTSGWNGYWMEITQGIQSVSITSAETGKATISVTLSDGTVSSLTIDTAAIGAGTITRVMLAADAVTETYTATLLSSAWTRVTPANGYYYHQDISDLPVMEKLIMDVDLSGFVASSADAVMAQTVEEEYGYIYLAIFTRAGVLRVFSRELPTVDIPLKFMGVYR